MTENVIEKLQLLPNQPGVYIMKDNHGKIIYVGKAVVLKNRVRQYFQTNKNHSAKVKSMVAKIDDFETIITGSEIEALILECNLIKKHRPKYNISLKDDKTYPYVKVTLNEPYPRVLTTRRVVKDGARYFGPYTNAGAVHESIKLLRRLFPLRSCKNMDVDRPCLEYHIKRCLAPCTGNVDVSEYNDMIKAVCLFLEGRSDAVEKNLTERMAAAADNFKFELAAKLRDQLIAVRKISEKQNIVTGAGDQDAVGMARSEFGVCMQVFFIRSGKMVGRDHFLVTGSEEESDETVLEAFLKQYYNQATFIPREVLLPFELSEQSLLEAWLSKQKAARVELESPKRGTKKDIVQMATGNAEKFLADEATKLKQANAQTLGAVAELQRHLQLSKAPNRMECFDISHIQGSETVASMVVFEGGVPNKAAYRRFKIRSAEGKPDDFLSMREVTMRRYGDSVVEDMPDLIIIDGGKGQLSSALEIIRGAGHLLVPVVGLAKQFEYIFTEGESEPVILPRHSQALYLVQRIRDEAHRFAVTYHRKLRSKRNLVSVLDHIVGIGPKRRKLLLDYFGSVDKIKTANVEAMAGITGMNLPAAQAVYNFFASRNEI
ncbi:Excinuclease ABC subunit C [Propionispira arboris]|uniref:UvrABC system protein C n=1 Tax=Propionispira arboris TaxID=84035 RepID=A0A1H7CC55_9FIRM|nr:excinuclease ABC subunit UvrC [Propionispira arboris]SEJ87271.1 Excinuclease ABC subunit C [Propionispira arboris]